MRICRYRIWCGEIVVFPQQFDRAIQVVEATAKVREKLIHDGRSTIP